MAEQKLNIEKLTAQMQKQFEQDIVSLIEFQEKALAKFIAKDKDETKTMDGLHKIISNG